MPTRLPWDERLRRQQIVSMNVKSVIVMIGIVAVVVLIIFRLGNQSPSESSTTTPASDQPILVDIAPVTVGSITESIQAVGTLEAVASITVRPEIAGVIRRIHFQDGQVVERAAPLLELEQEELQSQVTQAAAEENMALVTYERLKRITDEQSAIVPAQQMDEARMAWHAAAANRRLYEARLKKTVIRASFSGTLGFRRVSIGDYVQPGQDLVNLEDLQNLHVDFKVAEVWLSRLHVGQPLIVTTEAFPNATFAGRVTAIDPRVDAVNRTVAVRAVIPNPAGTLRPGLFVTVRLTVGEDTHALLIPEEAEFLRQEKTMVFQVEERIARLKEVSLGVRERGMVQVRAGLKEGDQVVRTGTHKLRDGAPVSIKSSE
ncbi:putative Multidrug efflux transporter, membrane fusion protein [Candidatus Nitrospira nitrificans]|uniref:Putative Multidrug efflux transporter, membrane fusion protein n=2 Tax=Candidatus Nitrospira nitrificans TaxID=1742973 RepID=A0A0S4LJ15_9BACT|nr:putative Multidrug efflux transporter, membrane fusion protein [Candidatus Nitrospira nitrificans]